jgi:hypothetical protein
VRHAVEQWKEGRLDAAGEAEACQRHEFHDHGE